MNMVIHIRPQPDDHYEPFMLGGQEIPMVHEYKYLGIWLQQSRKWNKWNGERIKKAKRQTIHHLRWCGVRSGGLSVQLGNRVMDMILTTTLLYGAEVTTLGKKEHEKAQVVQNIAANQLLGVPSHVNQLTTHGDLAWIPLEAKHAVAQLRLLNQLQRMPPTCLASRVFVYRWNRFQERWGTAKPCFGLLPTLYSHTRKYNLQWAWCPQTEVKSERWKEQVKKEVTEVEAVEWRGKVERKVADGSVSTQWYTRLRDVNEWVVQPYLLGGRQQHNGRKLISQLRTYTSPLNAHASKINPSLPLQCPTCTSGDDPPSHLIIDCATT